MSRITTLRARKAVITLMALVLTIGAGSSILAQSGPQGHTYYACLAKSNGQLYSVQIDNPDLDCRPGDQVISWNQVGPQGPVGPEGPMGPRGDDVDVGPLAARVDQLEGQVEALNDLVQDLIDIPTIGIDNVEAEEGDSGITEFVFTVTLSRAYGLPITVNYATEPGTATPLEDYNPVSGTLQIPAGQTSATIVVEVIGNVFTELNETFYVNLSNASHGFITRPQGTGTIVNDDLPILRINSAVTCVYGASCPVWIAYTGQYDGPVTVQISTRDGSAIAGTHYQSVHEVVTLAPGQNQVEVIIRTIAPGTFQSFGDRQLYVDMSNPTNARFFGSNVMSTVTLRDQ